MRFVVAGLVLTIVGFAGYFGYQKYEQMQLISSIAPHVKNASIRVQSATRFETVEDNKVTFKEAFDRIDSDIVEIENRLIEIKSLTSSRNANVAESSVAYLEDSQEYLRALRSKIRAQMKLSAAVDLYKDSLSDVASAGRYGVAYATKRFLRRGEEYLQGKADFNRSKSGLAFAALKLIESRASLEGTLASDALVPVAQLRAVAEKNSSSDDAGEAKNSDERGPAAQSAVDAGKKLYETACQACHGTGVAGAPKFGDKAAWAARIKQGNDTLVKHAIEGFKGMPAKGGSAAPDAEVKAAVEYMLDAAKHD